MQRYVPADLLEHVREAIFITDEHGRVEFCNATASALLQRKPEEVLGRCCWDVTLFRSLDGRLLCRSRCVLQRRAREGTLPQHQQALLVIGEERPLKIDLFSFPVSPPCARRVAVLHLLRPTSNSEALLPVKENGAPLGKPVERLSPREREVLRHLSLGMRTDEVAEALCLSPATVRNHVRSILSKMNAHRRIEAVLTWLSSGDEVLRA